MDSMSKDKGKLPKIIVIFLLCIIVFVIFLVNNKKNQNVTSQGLDIKKYIGLSKSDYIKMTGKDITVAILDSGINQHDDIENSRIIKFKDFVDYKHSYYDDYGHGTFVSGIIAANGKIKGIAPEVNLVVLKVMDKDGNASSENLLEALTWLVLNRNELEINIVNLSLGIKLYNDERITQKINLLIEDGVVVVVSAGNEGPHEGSILYPGTIPDTLTVGYVNNQSTYSIFDDTIALSSGKGLNKDNSCKPDLVTLGIEIKSLDYKKKNGYRIDSGSSYAAAITSGVVALMLQKDKGMKNKEIIDILIENAIRLDVDEQCAQGFGELYIK